MAVEICGVAAEEIRSTYRPGPPLGEGRNKDRKTPRPLIVTLVTPQQAEQLHDYGSSRKVIYDVDDETEVTVYINEDLILSDRIANHEAREARRKRIQQKDAQTKNFHPPTES